MARNNNIYEFIPQREPMVMVDEHVLSENHKTITKFSIVPGSLFVENSMLTEAGIIENIAQSAAVHSGYLFKQSGSDKSPIGFIATIQDLQIHYYPKIGDELQTEINFVDEVLGVSLIEGTSRCNQNICATCKMKIFVKK
jgi:3-hydroxyacyl-[acyl-carrier-protein] dehydratase